MYLYVFIVSYLTYAAVSLSPDENCNPTLSTHGVYGVGPKVIGLILSAISIVWVAVMTARRMASLMSHGGVLTSGIVNVVTGSHSGMRESNTTKDLENNLTTTMMNFNFIFIMICFYISMTLTNWGTLSLARDKSNSSHASNTSMWMHASGAWIVLGLYIFGLILPTFRILPRSIWDLQPKF
jgi:magnesium-transporting ATPase (P-type)